MNDARIQTLAREAERKIADLRSEWDNCPPGPCPNEWTHTGTRKIIGDAIRTALKEVEVVLRCNNCGEELQRTTNCHVVYCVKCRKEAIEELVAKTVELEDSVKGKDLAAGLAIKHLEVANLYNCQRTHKIADLEAKLEAAEKDTARLDWVMMYPGTNVYFGLKVGIDFREAIDAARQAEEGK